MNIRETITTTERFSSSLHLQAIGDDGQELDVGPAEEGDHGLQPAGMADGHLGAFLVEEEVVQCRDGVEEDAFVVRRKQLHQSRDPTALVDAVEALAMVAQVVQSARRTPEERRRRRRKRKRKRGRTFICYTFSMRGARW